jgi:hypothetical protein
MSFISRPQLAVLVADVARRDSLIASWKPVHCSDWGEADYYHEADVRTLYPGCSIAYAGPHRLPCQSRPISLYDWVVTKDGVRIATHRAMVVLSTTGEPFAVVCTEARYEPTPPFNELTAPEPSLELLAALEADPL